MNQQLKKFLQTAAPWEKLATEIDSVFVVKVPGPKSNPVDGSRLMIEINPVDEMGKPKKRKGLFISSYEMYIQFAEAINEDSLPKLMKTIEEINPEKKSKKMKKLIMG